MQGVPMNPLRAGLFGAVTLRAGIRALPALRALLPSACRPLAVLSPGRIPSTDYYFSSRSHSGVELRILDTLAQRPQCGGLDGCDVVVVRHAPSDWLRLLARERSALGRVVLFMDDDLPAAVTAGELPLRYALRTSWRHATTCRLLSGVCDQIWVSTPELQRRYGQFGVQLLPPLWFEAGAVDPASVEPVGQDWFYHGTAAHRREIEWLLPIVREVQDALPQANFEIAGGDAVRMMFKGIPRASVCPPLGWPQYLARTMNHRKLLGLAPCLDSSFNRARSHVKLFDITRTGAAGIYSRLEPYAGVVQDGKTGWLCENRQADWVALILRCLRDAESCRALQARALGWCRDDAIAGRFP